MNYWLKLDTFLKECGLSTKDIQWCDTDDSIISLEDVKYISNLLKNLIIRGENFQVEFDDEEGCFIITEISHKPEENWKWLPSDGLYLD